MKTLAKYYVCNRSVIGEKTFKNILNGPGKLPGYSRVENKAIKTYSQFLSIKKRDYYQAQFFWKKKKNKKQISSSNNSILIRIMII